MKSDITGMSEQNQSRNEAVVQALLKIAKNISRKREGALFIVADGKDVEGTYKPLYPQMSFDGDILSEGMNAVIEKIATLDGAMVISKDGKILAYGSKIEKSTPLMGFGTKHAAAKGITEYALDTTAILVSEETGWIKIFQKGQIVIETDSIDIEPTTLHKVSAFLTRHGTALLVGAGISVATLSVSVPTVLIIGGVYVMVRSALNMISGMLGRKLA